MISRSLPKGAPQPGAVFAEKYKVERVLGIGGMGYVFAATHLHLQEPVAIKMLLPRSVEDRTVIERFLREGRAAVKIRSEHVVRVLDVDELPDHTPYMVMEYLEGVDLSELLSREIRLEPARAVGYVLQALEAVAKAHALRMVHRDVKPSNLFLTKTDDGADCIKVLDFGISKIALHDADLAITKTSDALGTPLYMSPEQLKNSRGVDERADIWAVGVVLFELISGQPPFFADSFAELGALVLSGKTPSLVDRAPHVDPALAEVVATCLRLDPAERFVNVADLADALVPFGGTDARPRADRIIKAVGMPATRAKRTSVSPLTTTVPHVAPRAAVSSAPALAQLTAPMPPIEPAIPMLAPARTTLSSSLERRAEGQDRKAGLGVWVAVPLVLVVLAAGGVFAYRQRQGGAAPIAPSSNIRPSAPEPSASAPSESPTPTAAAATTPPTSESAPSAASSSPVAASALDAGRLAAPAKTAGTRTAPTASSARPAPGAPAPSKKNCDPNFVIDADGTKRWKPECF